MNSETIDAAYLRANPLPRHDYGTDKHSRGRVLVIAGSIEVPGAALLAGLGVLRAGAGVLQIATCKSNACHLGMAMPEAMIIGCQETSAGEIDPSNASRLVDLANEADAILSGPGMIDEIPIAELRAELLSPAKDPVFILDAPAFTSLRHTSGLSPSCRAPIIVTPHSGEMAKFLRMAQNEIEADPLAAARTTADLLQAVVAMKGARTHVVSPQGKALFCDRGPIALATYRATHLLASWRAWRPAERLLSSQRHGPSICTARPAADG
jgi:ADP-dependent NAD(P)H-hydrate dehydratase